MTFQLASLTPLLLVLVLAAVVAALALVTALVAYGIPAVVRHRADRLARHESIPTYWRHTFAH